MGLFPNNYFKYKVPRYSLRNDNDDEGKRGNTRFLAALEIVAFVRCFKKASTERAISRHLTPYN